jgi:hypothetical protein
LSSATHYYKLTSELSKFTLIKIKYVYETSNAMLTFSDNFTCTLLCCQVHINVYFII